MGLVAGVATGLGLLLLVTRVVTVTARGGDAEPPLAVVVEQAPGLAGFLGARKNVELGLALRGVDPEDARDRAADALAAVGLTAHSERRVDLLSAGQRERVALARVFAARTHRRDRGRADLTARRIDHARDRRASGRARARHGHDGCVRDARPAPHRPRRSRGAAARIVPGTIAQVTSATLQVSGVRCERCIGRLAGALRGHEGIEYANANLMGEVALQWDDEKTSRDAIVAALARSGFPEVLAERE